MLAANTAPFVRTAVMATDNQIVNWAHGGQAGADDADTILCRRPYSGFCISPLRERSAFQTKIEEAVAYRLRRGETGGSQP